MVRYGAAAVGVDHYESGHLIAEVLRVGHDVRTAQRVADENQGGMLAGLVERRVQVFSDSFRGDRRPRVAPHDARATVRAGACRESQRVVNRRPGQRASDEILRVRS